MLKMLEMDSKTIPFIIHDTVLGAKGCKIGKKKSKCVERRCVIIGYLPSEGRRAAFFETGKYVKTGCFEKVVVRRF